MRGRYSLAGRGLGGDGVGVDASSGLVGVVGLLHRDGETGGGGLDTDSLVIEETLLLEWGESVAY